MAGLPDRNPTRPLSQDELHDLEEYERIARFHDVIAAGAHPRVKIPSSVVTKPLSDTIASPRDLPQSATPRTSRPDHISSSKSTIPKGPALQPPGDLSQTQNNVKSTADAQARGPSTSRPVVGFNPILLEKSDDLVKAEIQLQRQRLERHLGDQIDHRRGAYRNAGQAEVSTDIDIPDVFDKAMSLVQAANITTLSSAGTNDASARNKSRDSFDDDTFYSSSLESFCASYSRSERDEVQASETQQSHAMASALTTGNALPRSIHQPHHGINHTNSSPSGHGEQQIPDVSGKRRTDLVAERTQGGQGSSLVQGCAEMAMGTDQPQMSHGRQAANAEKRQPFSPLIRAHKLTPIAPQPAHVPPLIVARHAKNDRQHQDSVAQAAQAAQTAQASHNIPAAVSMLRNQLGTMPSSPESWSQGRSGKQDKKKGRKKAKRKADRQAPKGASSSPHIKAESDSPLHLTSLPYSRPHKRQRQARRESDGISYSEPRSVYNVFNDEPYISAPRVYRGERLPVSYQPQEPYEPRRASSVVVVGATSDGPHAHPAPYFDDRRVTGGSQFVGRPLLPDMYSKQYVSQDMPLLRAASHALDGRNYPEGGHYLKSMYPSASAGRVSVRPEMEPAIPQVMFRDGRSPVMGPPRPLPRKSSMSRVVVDPRGCEYVERYSPNLQDRQQATPLMIPDIQDLRYDALPQVASRRPGQDEIYNEDSAPYAQQRFGYEMPRRMFTQPNLERLRERDYMQRPVPLPNQEYGQTRGVSQGRRGADDLAWGMDLARPATVRPSESAHHQALRDHGELQSSRPSVFSHGFAANLPLPDMHRNFPLPREYGGHVDELSPYHSEYSGRPVDHYSEGLAHKEGVRGYVDKPQGPSPDSYFQERTVRPAYH